MTETPPSDESDLEELQNAELSFDYVIGHLESPLRRRRDVVEAPDQLNIDARRRREMTLAAAARATEYNQEIGDSNPTGMTFDIAAIEYIPLCLYDPNAPALVESGPTFRKRWNDLDEKERRMWLLYFLEEARNTTTTALVEHLEEAPEVCERIGLEDGPPHRSTVSSNRDFDTAERRLLEELAKRARHYAFRLGITPPGSDDTGEFDIKQTLTSEVSVTEKLDAARDIVEEVFRDVRQHIGFGRDPDAPNYQLPIGVFYALFAHLALEDSYIDTGVRTLQWMDLQPDVPKRQTVFRYLRDYSVDDITDDKFAQVTGTLLNRVTISDSVHLAFDLTNIPWYGDSGTIWTSGINATDNTSEAWKFAILSIVNPDHRYIIGARPIKDFGKATDYLRRFLRRARDEYDLSLKRVYVDSQFYQEDTVRVLRDVNAGMDDELEYLIQAKRQGEIDDLLSEARSEARTLSSLNYYNSDPDPVKRKHVDFGGFSATNQPHAFAFPVPKKTAGNQGHTPTFRPFLTDVDVDARDLMGLGYQYRRRWGIETAIREAKNRFYLPTNADDGAIRAWYFSVGVFFYNLQQYVNEVLPGRLGLEDVLPDQQPMPEYYRPPDTRVSGEELLHVIRDHPFDGTIVD